MDNEQLYEAALKAIQKLFSDISLSQAKAQETLNSLILKAEKLIESLDI